MHKRVALRHRHEDPRIASAQWGTAPRSELAVLPRDIVDEIVGKPLPGGEPSELAVATDEIVVIVEVPKRSVARGLAAVRPRVPGLIADRQRFGMPQRRSCLRTASGVFAMGLLERDLLAWAQERDRDGVAVHVRPDDCHGGIASASLLSLGLLKVLFEVGTLVLGRWAQPGTSLGMPDPGDCQRSRLCHRRDERWPLVS